MSFPMFPTLYMCVFFHSLWCVTPFLSSKPVLETSSSHLSVSPKLLATCCCRISVASCDTFIPGPSGPEPQTLQTERDAPATSVCCSSEKRLSRSIFHLLRNNNNNNKQSPFLGHYIRKKSFWCIQLTAVVKTPSLEKWRLVVTELALKPKSCCLPISADTNRCSRASSLPRTANRERLNRWVGGSRAGGGRSAAQLVPAEVSGEAWSRWTRF